MEFYKDVFSRIGSLTKEVIRSYTDKGNQGFAAVSGFGGIICSWNIATIDVSGILARYALVFKIVGGIFSIVIAPPLSVFMKDLYTEKLKHRIFKSKTKY